jgi:hypothetical protein
METDGCNEGKKKEKLREWWWAKEEGSRLGRMEGDGGGKVVKFEGRIIESHKSCAD